MALIGPTSMAMVTLTCMFPIERRNEYFETTETEPLLNRLFHRRRQSPNITDSSHADYDGDGDPDLLNIGNDYLFRNDEGNFTTEVRYDWCRKSLVHGSLWSTQLDRL